MGGAWVAGGRSDPRFYGSVSRQLLDALADAVLETEEVQLATAVKDGGPHAVRRAIEFDDERPIVMQ